MDSTNITKTKEIFELGQKYNVVGIDEAQFFNNDLIKYCKKLASNKTRVIVAGLVSDYKGFPFGPMRPIAPNLFRWWLWQQWLRK